MIHVTCRLTAKCRNQLRNRTLGNRVWATFFLSLLPNSTTRARRNRTGPDQTKSADFVRDPHAPARTKRTLSETRVSDKVCSGPSSGIWLLLDECGWHSYSRDVCTERATSNSVGAVRLHRAARTERRGRRLSSLSVEHRRRPAPGHPRPALHLRPDTRRASLRSVDVTVSLVDLYIL